MQKLAGSVEHSAHVIANNPDGALGAIGDLEPFLADARLDGQLHHQRRITLPDDLRFAAALDLAHQYSCDVLHRQARLRRKNQAKRFHRLG